MAEERNQLNIEVRDKIATLTSQNFQLVCGNNDYEVVFDFDNEWSENNAKTALFVFGDNSVAMPFEGNVCEGVAIENATICCIGVFAGNIKTTTPAEVTCILQSIRDIGNIPKQPTPSVYDKIMEMLDKAIEAHTELPKGGTAGQVLKKKSDKDYDTAWEDDGGSADVGLSNYYTREETDTKLTEILGEISQGLDDLHQVALSYQIGDIESAMQSLTDAVDGLESEVSGD